MLRILLLGLSLIGCLGCHIGDGSNITNTSMSTAAWEQANHLANTIKTPLINDREFRLPLTSIQGDWRTPIQLLIDSCSAQGGGRVIIGPGKYMLQGPIHLKSKVELHLEENAELLFDTVPAHYTPLVKVRWEGTVCWNYSPFIYAYRQHDIALTGQGEINGQSLSYWYHRRSKQNPDKDRLRQMGNDLIPEDERVFGHGYLDLDADGEDDGYGDGQPHYLRPSLIEFYECERVLIEGLTLRESPFWTVHPVFCDDVTIRGLTIYGGFLNDDGIDPDGSHRVLIEDCYIETHDDAISIKAGRDQDAWNRRGTRDVLVRNCTLHTGVNAFCIGSEMSGGVRDIFVENCKILTSRHALNFKCNLDRGGEVQRVFMRNLDIDTCSRAMFVFRMDYHGYRGNHFPTRFHDFYAQNITCDFGGETVFRIVGVADAPIRDITLQQIRIEKGDTLYQLKHVEGINASDIIFQGEEVHIPANSVEL